MHKHRTFRNEARGKTRWVVHKPAPLSWMTISDIPPDKTRQDTNQSRQCSQTHRYGTDHYIIGSVHIQCGAWHKIIHTLNNDGEFVKHLRNIFLFSQHLKEANTMTSDLNVFLFKDNVNLKIKGNICMVWNVCMFLTCMLDCSGAQEGFLHPAK